VLSAQARPVPVDASVSKFSDKGAPKVVMLPLLVKADELEISREPARRNRSDKNISPVSKLEREATVLGIQKSSQKCGQGRMLSSCITSQEKARQAVAARLAKFAQGAETLIAKKLQAKGTPMRAAHRRKARVRRTAHARFS
jgi:hypothetical protein